MKRPTMPRSENVRAVLAALSMLSPLVGAGAVIVIFKLAHGVPWSFFLPGG